MTAFALTLAALLLFGTGIAHSYLGERRLIGPLLAPEKRVGMLETSGFARQVLRFAWHLTTLVIWGLAAILIGLVVAPSGAQTNVTLAVIAVTCLLASAVILLTSGGRHLAWPVFLASAGLCIVPLF